MTHSPGGKSIWIAWRRMQDDRNKGHLRSEETGQETCLKCTYTSAWKQIGRTRASAQLQHGINVATCKGAAWVCKAHLCDLQKTTLCVSGKENRPLSMILW